MLFGKKITDNAHRKSDRNVSPAPSSLALSLLNLFSTGTVIRECFSSLLCYSLMPSTLPSAFYLLVTFLIHLGSLNQVPWAQSLRHHKDFFLIIREGENQEIGISAPHWCSLSGRELLGVFSIRDLCQ